MKNNQTNLVIDIDKIRNSMFDKQLEQRIFDRYSHDENNFIKDFLISKVLIISKVLQIISARIVNFNFIQPIIFKKKFSMKKIKEIYDLV